ncbi:hypothetical protein K490DRAFT_56646 [Saccharata proteae CBS 121410]|uniref:Uncharacterized protein n=1 Tax=Saccharata proteae CBS 121410 TaxID=1314787 RepID=A0A9P4LWY7_9PEZI|nr:hypothetical protein K490DRAFT_56646 [Saccharata proteae CBS 121410]
MVSALLLGGVPSTAPPALVLQAGFPLAQPKILIQDVLKKRMEMKLQPEVWNRTVYASFTGLYWSLHRLWRISLFHHPHHQPLHPQDFLFFLDVSRFSALGSFDLASTVAAPQQGSKPSSLDVSFSFVGRPLRDTQSLLGGFFPRSVRQAAMDHDADFIEMPNGGPLISTYGYDQPRFDRKKRSKARQGFQEWNVDLHDTSAADENKPVTDPEPMASSSLEQDRKPVQSATAGKISVDDVPMDHGNNTFTDSEPMDESSSSVHDREVAPLRITSAQPDQGLTASSHPVDGNASDPPVDENADLPDSSPSLIQPVPIRYRGTSMRLSPHRFDGSISNDVGGSGYHRPDTMNNDRYNMIMGNFQAMGLDPSDTIRDNAKVQGHMSDSLVPDAGIPPLALDDEQHPSHHYISSQTAPHADDDDDNHSNYEEPIKEPLSQQQRLGHDEKENAKGLRALLEMRSRFQQRFEESMTSIARKHAQLDSNGVRPKKEDVAPWMVKSMTRNSEAYKTARQEAGWSKMNQKAKRVFRRNWACSQCGGGHMDDCNGSYQRVGLVMTEEKSRNGIGRSIRKLNDQIGSYDPVMVAKAEADYVRGGLGAFQDSSRGIWQDYRKFRGKKDRMEAAPRSELKDRRPALAAESDANQPDEEPCSELENARRAILARVGIYQESGHARPQASSAEVEVPGPLTIARVGADQDSGHAGLQASGGELEDSRRAILARAEADRESRGTDWYDFQTMSLAKNGEAGKEPTTRGELEDFRRAHQVADSTRSTLKPITFVREGEEARKKAAARGELTSNASHMKASWMPPGYHTASAASFQGNLDGSKKGQPADLPASVSANQVADQACAEVSSRPPAKVSFSIPRPAGRVAGHANANVFSRPPSHGFPPVTFVKREEAVEEAAARGARTNLPRKPSIPSSHPKGPTAPAGRDLDGSERAPTTLPKKPSMPSSHLTGAAAPAQRDLDGAKMAQAAGLTSPAPAKKSREKVGAEGSAANKPHAGQAPYAAQTNRSAVQTRAGMQEPKPRRVRKQAYRQQRHLLPQLADALDKLNVRYEEDEDHDKDMVM